MDTATRILMIGDMHLGRSPARLPDSLAHYGLEPRELGPAAAWRRAIRYALENKPAAVVLAGDLVESDNARFEAFGHLQDGIGRLGEAGIPVFAVAGNHDVVALPRLATILDNFHLLGAGGVWNEGTVVSRGNVGVRLVGWSFPQRQVSTSPLADGLPPRLDAAPRLGILHADLDAAGSRYAPVTSAELAAADVDAWLLGHIHKPTLTPWARDRTGERRPPGYLGSLVGLDPTETGCHGPWLVSIGDDGTMTSRQLPLAPLRWESFDVPITDLDDLSGLFEHVVAGVKQRYTELSAELGTTRALGCRIRLTGRRPDYHALERLLRDDSRRDESLVGSVIPCGETMVFLDRIVNETTVEHDLGELAAAADPPGLLARRLLAVAAADGSDGELLARARRRALRIIRQSRFLELDLPDPDDAALQRVLLQAGYRALDELLAQREADDASA